MKTPFYICWIPLFLFFTACNDSKAPSDTKMETKSTSAKTAAKPAANSKQNAWNYVHDPEKPYAILDHQLPMNKKYPNIPQSELGITIVSPDGWEEKEMEFHMGYCDQMMASVADQIRSEVFCACFLEKIQYYYEPIYFKDAYEDQSRWNQYCYAKAAKAKEDGK